jgi:NAD(P)-dependent dehydrogenase (short-subunit alcohol dehydrogenase family)
MPTSMVGRPPREGGTGDPPFTRALVPTDVPAHRGGMTTTPRIPIAVVTGGSRGIGRATALALARANVDVVITYRTSEVAAKEVTDEIASYGRRGTALPLDTTDLASIATFVQALRPHLPSGSFDTLVNNAGSALYSRLAATSEADFDRVFTEHVKGPFFLTQMLLPLIADGGRIVNISSALTRVSVPASGPYAAAKAAVEALTRYEALEFADRRITANVVAPGAVPTDFGDAHLRSDPGLQKFLVENTALGRLATPEDIGQLIAGLTTASGTWVTGQRIEASGGMVL